MLEENLRRLGHRIDLIVDKIRIWNRGMPWYKVKAYLFVIHRIKNNDFKSDEHFYRFMKNLRNFNYLWNWQYNRLIKMYERNR